MGHSLHNEAQEKVYKFLIAVIAVESWSFGLSQTHCMHQLLQGDALEVARGQGGVLATPLGRLVLPGGVQHNAMKAQLGLCCCTQQSHWSRNEANVYASRMCMCMCMCICACNADMHAQYVSSHYNCDMHSTTLVHHSACHMSYCTCFADACCSQTLTEHSCCAGFAMVALLNPDLHYHSCAGCDAGGTC